MGTLSFRPHSSLAPLLLALSAFAFVKAATTSTRLPAKCGKTQACPFNLCCSSSGNCGTGARFCGLGCQAGPCSLPPSSRSTAEHGVGEAGRFSRAAPEAAGAELAVQGEKRGGAKAGTPVDCEGCEGPSQGGGDRAAGRRSLRRIGRGKGKGKGKGKGTAGGGGGAHADILTPHNDARAKVKVDPLKWDDTVANSAQDWANHLKNTNNCNMKHTQGGKYGENLAWSSGSLTGTEATNLWVAEKQYYTHAIFPDGCQGGWQNCGHYTQVVWKGTTTVGCGSATCSDGSTIYVCQYNPPGNVVGEWPY